MGRATVKRAFTLKLTYFKPNGKYYTSATTVCRVATLPNGGCCMQDAVAYIRGTRNGGGQGSMPGLSRHSEGWDGFILVDCDEGYPHLILPSKD